VKKFSKLLLWAFLLSTAAGVLLHFLYGWLPSPLTAIFSPVKESIWEHLKILYWPLLGAALLLTRGGERGCRAPWLLSLLVVCGTMLGAAYWYHLIFQGEEMLFDLILYFLLMAAGFLLPRLFVPLAGRGWWSEALWVLVLLLGGVMLLFTFLPPVHPLFTDLSAVRTWFTIPF